MADRREILRKTPLVWPDERHPEWFVRATWADVGGRPEVVGLELWKGAGPDDEDAGFFYAFRKRLEPMRATDLRLLPLATIVDKLRRVAAEQDRRGSTAAAQARGEVRQSAVTAAIEPLLAELEKPSRFEAAPTRSGPGRRPVYDRAHYLDVARVYLQAWQEGRPPRKAVAEHFDATPTAAAKWIATARNDLRLLDETSPGRPSGATGKRPRKRNR